jgi:hypothetical protein
MSAAMAFAGLSNIRVQKHTRLRHYRRIYHDC